MVSGEPGGRARTPPLLGNAVGPESARAMRAVRAVCGSSAHCGSSTPGGGPAAAVLEGLWLKRIPAGGSMRGVSGWWAPGVPSARGVSLEAVTGCHVRGVKARPGGLHGRRDNSALSASKLQSLGGGAWCVGLATRWAGLANGWRGAGRLGGDVPGGTPSAHMKLKTSLALAQSGCWHAVRSSCVSYTHKGRQAGSTAGLPISILEAQQTIARAAQAASPLGPRFSETVEISVICMDGHYVAGGWWQ